EDRMYKYIRGFGFGSQTGIELSGETRGITKPVNRWSKMSIGAISMGQEIGVSPLQLVAMTSSIANDGVWTPPRIVAGSTPVGQGRAGPAQTVVFRPGQQHRVISQFSAAQMKRMLEEVILRGTGKKAILDGYTSAGKTGTAQKINPVTHRYDRVKDGACVLCSIQEREFGSNQLPGGSTCRDAVRRCSRAEQYGGYESFESCRLTPWRHCGARHGRCEDRSFISRQASARSH